MSRRPPLHAVLNPSGRPGTGAHHPPRHRNEPAFQAFVSQAGFPCVGAKAALARGGIETLHCGPITSALDDHAIARHLVNFARRWSWRPRMFSSLVVLFDGPRALDERQYERALWQRIQRLTDRDQWLGQACSPDISSNPLDAHFALSFGGQAFFAVGLHPHASRKARRFRCPAIVFNLHEQFSRLRADGRYEPMRATILRRDEAWSGSINPMLVRHGEASEARQYSGRNVPDNWTCPYHR